MKDKVKTKWVIRLPLKAKLFVEVGEVIKQNQLIAETEDLEIRSYNYTGFLGKLTFDKLEDINSKFKGEIVRKGDLVCVKNGFLGKKICFPDDGKFLEIDEFGNLKIELDVGEKVEIKSPVNSKVSKIEENRVVLDFWVKQFDGEGLVEGKSWGNGKLEIINRLDQLGPEMEGKILFTDNLDQVFLLKAEVVGVTGIVTKINKDDLKIKIPILKLSDEGWEELLKMEGDEYRFLLNSTLGRLLLVLE